MGLGPFWVTSIALALTSSIVAGIVMYIYWSNLLKVKSRFATGLSAFITLIVVKNILSAFFYLDFALRDIPASVAMPIVIVGTLELVGFSILLAVTWKPG